jgi:hypothetical protein
MLSVGRLTLVMLSFIMKVLILWMTLCFCINMLNVFAKYCEAMCHYAVCHFREFLLLTVSLGECSNAEFCYTDSCSLVYHYTDHHYGEWRYNEFLKLIMIIQSAKSYLQKHWPQPSFINLRYKKFSNIGARVMSVYDNVCT